MKPHAPRRLLASCLLLLAGPAWQPLAAGEDAAQLPNLKGVPRAERTILPLEFTWPAQAGEAALCLWRDDKMAALSYTIDDNCAMNIDWWLKETAERDLRVTWFLVAGGVSNSNPTMNGTWERWKAARAAGHALESHTVTHLSAAKNEATWKGIDWEYAQSKALIEAGLGDGHRVTCLAYPGGGQSSKNDPAVAAAHYVAARSTRGMLNGPQGFDYLAVNAMSKANFGERPESAFNNADNLMNPAYKQGYRGWCVVLYHYVKEGDPAVVAGVRADLDYAVKHRERLWVGTFPDVARYAQQRETARLAVAESAPERIAFDLTDRMDDRVFDVPLTVKVRLPEGWTTATATQAGKPAPVRLVAHDGAQFALVDAIPDRGRTTLVR